jgi:hypothetical protein
VPREYTDFEVRSGHVGYKTSNSRKVFRGPDLRNQRIHVGIIRNDSVVYQEGLDLNRCFMVLGFGCIHPKRSGREYSG